MAWHGIKSALHRHGIQKVIPFYRAEAVAKLWIELEGSSSAPEFKRRYILTKLVIDLCSGYGTLSQAFKDAGWEVITVDCDENFDPTMVLDITSMPAIHLTKLINDMSKRRDLKAYKEIVLIASPPCERFSVANHDWPRKGIREAFDLVGACLDLVVELKMYPNFRFWALENPRGRLRWFLGKPRDTIRLADYGMPYQKLTDIWGNIPFQMLLQSKPHTMYLRPHKKDGSGKWKDYLRSDKKLRAKMPYALSQALLDGVESG